jgi:LuxR family maltose regulon positive regulatory protein
MVLGFAQCLNALAMGGRIDVSGNGPSQSFQSYIEKNVWAKLDEITQDFLIKTSVPDRFTLELCVSLTEDENCEEILEKLIVGNVNISLFGSEYRYHNLFLEFLRGRLEHSNINRRELNKKVAQYHLEKGDFLTAKNYAMKSGDAAIISQVVRSFYSLKTFSLDEYIEVHKLYGMDLIPEVICERAPLLYIPRIFYSYALGDLDGVSRYLDKLYPLMPRIAEVNPEVVEHVSGMVMLDCRVKLSELPEKIKGLPKITLEQK